jgi:flagellar biosynthesis/type III secretory pathway protein FliH
MWSSARSRALTGTATPAPWTLAALDAPVPLAETAPAAPAVDPVAEAYALGFAQGRSEGELAERARLAPAVRVAEEALDAINARDLRWTGAAAENVALIAMAVARHLVEHEIDADPTLLDALVGRALASFPVDQPVRVRVHPEDAALLTRLGDARDAAISARSSSDTVWVADPSLARGGCVVEGRERIVDGRIESALERIYRRVAHRA